MEIPREWYLILSRLSATLAGPLGELSTRLELPLAYNVLGLPIALGVLYPFFGILLSPLLAAIAMSFSSVTVITNANRLKRWKPRVA
jgi:hypothetical protein